MTIPLNPYDFVPFPDTIVRKNIQDWVGTDNLSGYLECTIKPLSPVCIHSVFKKDKPVYIPASSIKGMLRHLISTLAGGCAEFIDRDYRYKRTFSTAPRHSGIQNYTIEYFVTHCKFSDTEEYDSSPHRSCREIIEKDLSRSKLCRTCYLFGLTHTKGAQAGRIRITDTDTVSTPLEEITIPQMDLPRVYHWPFYFKNDLQNKTDIYPTGQKPHSILDKYPFETKSLKTSEKLPTSPSSHKLVHIHEGIYRGRKFYRHGQAVAVPKEDVKKETIAILPPESFVEFTFRLYFDQITQNDLDLLIFTLMFLKHPPKTETDNIKHKIGYGKPLGLGSVEISVNKCYVLTESRYSQLAKNLFNDQSDKIADMRNRFFKQVGTSVQFQKLCDIWKWPGNQIRYPDLSYFGNKNNSKISLDDYNLK